MTCAVSAAVREGSKAVICEQTGAVVEALRGEVEGWATLIRVPFEPQGAYVGEL
jgi:hypothetical protein